MSVASQVDNWVGGLIDTGSETLDYILTGIVALGIGLGAGIILLVIYFIMLVTVEFAKVYIEYRRAKRAQRIIRRGGS